MICLLFLVPRPQSDTKVLNTLVVCTGYFWIHQRLYGSLSTRYRSDRVENSILDVFALPRSPWIPPDPSNIIKITQILIRLWFCPSFKAFQSLIYYEEIICGNFPASQGTSREDLSQVLHPCDLAVQSIYTARRRLYFLPVQSVSTKFSTVRIPW